MCVTLMTQGFSSNEQAKCVLSVMRTLSEVAWHRILCRNKLVVHCLMLIPDMHLLYIVHAPVSTHTPAPATGPLFPPKKLSHHHLQELLCGH